MNQPCPLQRTCSRYFFNVTLPVVLLAFFVECRAESPRVYRDQVDPHWFADNSKFWYRNELPDGQREFIVVDTTTATRRPAFDHGRVAEAVSDAAGESVSRIQLPFTSLRFADDATSVTLIGDDLSYTVDLRTYQVSEPEPDKSPSSKPNSRSEHRRQRGGRSLSSPGISPDGHRSVFVKDHNLWLRWQMQEETSDLRNEVALTDGADEKCTFHKDNSRARLIGMQYNRRDAPPEVADVHWSPDSRYVLAFQTTTVSERRVQYVESLPKSDLQPQLHSYPYAKPGDPIPVRRTCLFDTEKQQEVKIATELMANPFELRLLKWSDDSSRFWLLYNERGHQVLRILEVNATDGAVRTVVDEHSDTFIHYSTTGKFVLEWLPENEVIWASERSGWNHLYRYDLMSGSVLNPVTSGQWNVRRIEKVDHRNRQVWFCAVGIVDDQDPYHEHFCRVDFDGGNLKVLTTGDGTHEIDFSPDRRFFLDRYSRVDFPPVTELRRSSDGSLVVTLEEADASEIVAERPLPQRFHAKGRDGETDIWGIIHRPQNFQSDRQYPIVECIYAGPHDHHVPKSFRARYQHQHQIADRGLIVVQIDGMGTAWRSKAFHDVCFRNLKDAGFPDRISWIKAAAAEFDWMDADRVGIYGGSAGGQNAMAALLWHGSFYRAAVADCGCHDNRMDKLWWNEQWMGWPVDESYAANSNMENAHLLQGHLMLVVGALDRNVDPATTTQVVQKLIEADIDFRFLLMPGQGHGACEHPYASKRRADFLATHLIDVPQLTD